MTISASRRTRHVLLSLAIVAVLLLAGCTADPGPEQSDTSIQFRDVTAETGIEYESVRSGRFSNGNEGLYAADVNNDGWQDVLAIGGTRPALYVNEGGTFERTGSLASLDREYRVATFVDYDGDGWRDLLLFAAGGEAVAFHNDEGTLRRADLDIGNFTFPLGAATADFDGDGDLDLFVYQSGSWGENRPAGYLSMGGRVSEDNGNANYLYENVNGTFRRVEDAGLVGKHWSLAASAVDFNGDGAPDIHVTNDFYNDEVYINRGNGTFEHQYLGNRTARNGMSSEVADVNGDGSPDVFVTNIYLPFREELSPERFERYEESLGFVATSDRTKGNNLLINDGTGSFTDRAATYGVREGGWGWAASLVDFDNDRDRDLIHTTQHVLRLNRSDPHYTYPLLFERTGDGFETLDASDHGLEEGDGRGMISLDYDNDGDVEVMTMNYGQNATVYDNVGTTGNSLQFVVGDEDRNRTAFGAVVTVTAAGESTVVHHHGRSDFLSQEPLVAHVGVADASTADVHVRWPDGTEQTFGNVSVNQRVRLTKSGIAVVTEL